MKMKKILCSLMISVLCFMTAISGVSAASYDTSKIDQAYSKMIGYYKSRTELRSLDEIIAVEALGLEAENYTLPDLSSTDFNTQSLGTISKGLISVILIGKNPSDYNNQNLVQILEDCVKDDGSVEKDGYVADPNIQVWVLYALESYNSPKAELVANNLISKMSVDGGFGYSETSLSVDVTGWCLEALSNLKNYDELSKVKNYLKNTDRFGDNGSWGYSYGNSDYPNSTSQAAVLMGLIVNDKNGLLNGEYNYNNINPLDVLAEYQNENGSYWNDPVSYETFDTARCLGTYKNGSVIVKAQSDYDKLINPEKPVNNEKNDVKDNKTATTSNTNKNAVATAVKTGDNTHIVVFVSLSMISGGLFLVLRKENEKAC